MIKRSSKTIAEKLLIEPICKGANRLCIVSFKATPSTASWLLKTYDELGIFDVSVELIVESVLHEGIDTASHEGFKELHHKPYSKFTGTFSCSYLYQSPSLDKNLYIWLNDETPVQAFSCSCDFTQKAMLKEDNGTIADCTASDAYSAYVRVVNQSIYCNHCEVEDYIIIRSSSFNTNDSGTQNSHNCVVLSLLTNTGEPGTKSGLNWGQRNKRNKNEAYIPLPSKVARSGFFPLEKQHFLAVTDDHHTLQLRVEQQNDKAITTPASNALLGEYFRNRLGLPNGAYVHACDLQAYGRTDVAFYKIDEEQYYMDFSPKIKGVERCLITTVKKFAE